MILLLLALCVSVTACKGVKKGGGGGGSGSGGGGPGSGQAAQGGGAVAPGEDQHNQGEDAGRAEDNGAPNPLATPSDPGDTRSPMEQLCDGALLPPIDPSLPDGQAAGPAAPVSPLEFAQAYQKARPVFASRITDSAPVAEQAGVTRPQVLEQIRGAEFGAEFAQSQADALRCALFWFKPERRSGGQGLSAEHATDLVKALVDKGADPSLAVVEDGVPIILRAIQMGDVKIVQAMLSKDEFLRPMLLGSLVPPGTPNMTGSDNALQVAVRTGKPEMVQLILDKLKRLKSLGDGAAEASPVLAALGARNDQKRNAY
jgi:hypothetical protein